VKVANRGTAPAENVRVVLRVDGEIVDEGEVIDVLEPEEVRTLTFSGPVCRRRMRVAVDPSELIAESNEKDNVRDPSCL
jgi:subtilase family serine protease